MSLFGTNATSVRYGALIDIGSGSVLVAIIASDPLKTHPDVIWSKREYAPLRDINSVTESAKNVMTSLLNALMKLDSEGRAAFKEATGKSKLPETQIAIAAPWSYTVTKSITYEHDETFTLSEDLIDELLRTAHKKVGEEIEDNEQVHNFDLSVISRSTTGVIANGYPVRAILDQQINTLKLIESSSIAQDYLIEAIREVKDKVLPGSDLFMYSFILMYYYVLKDLTPDTNEFCLVDVTYEATEIGIVREGILNYCTHTPFGAFSIAREIAAVLKIPLEEAYGYLHEEDPLTLLTERTTTERKEVAQIFTNYQAKITELFHETGDTLAIPKKIYLHGDLETETFFKTQVAKAAKTATKSSHAVFLVSFELLTKYYETEAKDNLLQKNLDTALLISAQFFHTTEYHKKFKQF